MQAVDECPDSDIYMIGHTSKTIYRNVIKLLFDDPALITFRPFCTWFGGNRNVLKFRDKTITALGAKDEGSVGLIQGLTASKIYCDEMTLYPQSVIEMINSRLSRSYSQGFAAMNPSHPSHIIKKWIDQGLKGDKNYYSLHFSLEDNPYIDDEYKQMLKNSSSGIFYKRNYLGQWCLAEGAIFDFFDRDIYVKKRPPRAAEYWIVGIDVGVSNNFACLLIGISTGKYDQTGICRWVEKEYVWDSKKQGRQKTMSEYADDVQRFIEPYSVKALYIDPSAAAFKVELRKRGIHVVDAINDVVEGINFMTSEMQKGNIYVLSECENTIREIESYVWDVKSSEKGEDQPLKKDDHCFAAGTMVSTINGPVDIAKIEIGSMVLTSIGYKRIVKKWHRKADAYKYNILGIKFICTDSHKFYTLNRGFVKISELNNQDLFVTNVCQLSSNPLNGKEEFIEDTQILRDLMTQITIVTEKKEGACLDISIETFGNSIMDQFHQDTIFITKTKIPLTTTLAISNALAVPTMQQFITKILVQNKNGGLKIFHDLLALSLQNGIAPTRGKRGTENMQNGINSEKMQNVNLGVMSVDQNLQPRNYQIQNFVRIGVNLDGEELCTLMMSLDCVRDVLKNFTSINIQKQSFVEGVVAKHSIGQIDVFDLTVEGRHEYFANGILVSNCIDALRYAIYTHKVSVFDYEAYKNRQQEYMQNRFQQRSNFR